MKILIAVDDSPHSERAVRFVTRMHWPAGSRVIVASVVTTAQREVHEAAIARARDHLRGAGLSTESWLAEGDAREQLLRVAELERVDLLVMGSRGHSGMTRVMLGSVSNHAVSHAACAVLVVKPSTWARGAARPAKERKGCDEDPDRGR